MAGIQGVGTLSAVSGCPCCDGGGGEPCDPCNGCDPVTASDFCLCLTRISLTHVDGCPSFDLTLSTPHCISGLCGSGGSVVFNDFAFYDYPIGDGRTVSVEVAVGIVCWNPPVEVYRLNASFFATLTDCPSYTGIAFTTLGSTDDCDIDSLMGSYAAIAIDPVTFDLIKFFFTISHSPC